MLTVDQLLGLKKSYIRTRQEGGPQKFVTIFCSALDCHQDLMNMLDVSLGNDSVFHYLDMPIPGCPWDCLSCTQLTRTPCPPFGFGYSF